MEDSCDKVTDSEGVNVNRTARQQEEENAFFLRDSRVFEEEIIVTIEKGGKC